MTILATGGGVFRTVALGNLRSDETTFSSDDLQTLDAPAILLCGSMIGQSFTTRGTLNYPLPSLYTRP